MNSASGTCGIITTKKMNICVMRTKGESKAEKVMAENVPIQQEH